MSLLQLFITLAGLTDQLLIVRKDPCGYLAWIAGNTGLVLVYWETKRFTLTTLQFVDAGIRAMALIAWRRAERCDETGSAQPREA